MSAVSRSYGDQQRLRSKAVNVHKQIQGFQATSVFFFQENKAFKSTKVGISHHLLPTDVHFFKTSHKLTHGNSKIFQFLQIAILLVKFKAHPVTDSYWKHRYQQNASYPPVIKHGNGRCLIDQWVS